MPFELFRIWLPYKPLYTRFMGPRKRSKQEHEHCEAINSSIQQPHHNPTSVIINMGMENQEEEWNGIVSEFYQWSRNKGSSSRQKVCHHPYLLLTFYCQSYHIKEKRKKKKKKRGLTFARKTRNYSTFPLPLLQ